MRSRWQCARFASAIATLVGCTDGEWVVERGLIDCDGSACIDAPTAADVGVPFNVTVTTYGGGCYYFETTNVVSEGSDTVIEPYDRHTAGDCTHILKRIAHDVSLRFDHVGTQIIRVRGFRSATGTEVIEVPMTISIN